MEPVSLRFRKLAREDGLERVRRYDLISGEPYWASPSTGQPLPKEVDGVALDMDEAPQLCRITSKYVGQAEFLELVNPRPVHKPAGPTEDPWRSTHTFVHADSVIFHLVDGDLEYRVVHQPDKYDDETGEPTDDAGDPTTHVDWFYDLELVRTEVPA